MTKSNTEGWRDVELLENCSDSIVANYMRTEDGRYGVKMVEIDRAIIQLLGPFDTIIEARKAAKLWKPR